MLYHLRYCLISHLTALHAAWCFQEKRQIIPCASSTVIPPEVQYPPSSSAIHPTRQKAVRAGGVQVRDTNERRAICPLPRRPPKTDGEEEARPGSIFRSPPEQWNSLADIILQTAAQKFATSAACTNNSGSAAKNTVRSILAATDTIHRSLTCVRLFADDNATSSVRAYRLLHPARDTYIYIYICIYLCMCTGICSDHFPRPQEKMLQCSLTFYSQWRRQRHLLHSTVL